MRLNITAKDFRQPNEILIYPIDTNAGTDGRCRFAVFWFDGCGSLRSQNRHDDMDFYIHRVTRNSKRPFRLI
ncbi:MULTISPECIES: hypothetical protein [unclassified Nocardia]|uniref:hypothetical protein n=1 Tax=unclassified Nocardia TaxID=2637762 RepID=UPI001CE48000|nr:MULTISPECIES: hypothetical protein [unclassified Nocardia]